MEKIPSFLKKNKNSLIFNDEGELIFYIPEKYFERNYSVIVGNTVNTMGIFDYTRIKSDGKNTGLKNFNFPTLFECRPSDIKKVKQIQLTKNSKVQDYRLLKFKKNDTVIVSVKVVQNVENAEIFYKMLTSGILPNTISYNKIHEYILENIALNGGDYGLNIQLFGIMISEMCRDDKNIKKIFRYSDINDMNNYQFLNIKQIPKYVSPFISITSENWDEAVVNAVINKNTKYTPLEKLFTL